MTQTRVSPPAADPRLYQIAILGCLLVYGLVGLDFDLSASRIGLTLATCLVTQYLCTQLWGLPRFDPRSPLISGLSLCLLLRTDLATLVVVTAIVSVLSKFLLRVDGRHLFNPTTFGLVVMMLATGQVWVSPGQWGSVAFFAFLLAGLGGLVVHRAARSDVTYAFLGLYAFLVIGRAVWLGDPLAIPLHHLQSGSLLLFAFFMISDPKTTPESRAGRVLFAGLVALGAVLVQFGLYRPNALLWSLMAVAPLTPFINRMLPGARYAWPSPRRDALGSVPKPSPRPSPRGRGRHRNPLLDSLSEKGLTPMTLFIPRVVRRLSRAMLLSLVLLVASTQTAGAFCGFYVTKADTTLFNRASKVVLARDGDRTVVTMANDFEGDPTEFAVVIPVPTLLTRDQIHVGNQTVIDHLDAYTAPRLVEYHDPDPCRVMIRELAAAPVVRRHPMSASMTRTTALGVTVEAAYTVGEYDIVILSAEQSGGLETWLTDEGYRLPTGAREVLGSYIKQGMRFFVARVNLEEQASLSYSYLRPLQIAYESPKFMLPIRLGTVNADGPQDLFVFTLTRKGRVETRNYRTVKLPTGMNLPGFLKGRDEFADFYQAMFSRQVDEANRRGVFLEYAWDMAWCDPCAADPLSRTELQELGVFWTHAPAQPTGRVRPNAAPDVFVTRLHVRYDAEHFPDDLRFQETADRTNFQGRYVLRQPWEGTTSCAQAAQYRQSLAARHEHQAQTLASLTGWDLQSVRTKMELNGPPPDGDDPSWWRRIWRR